MRVTFLGTGSALPTGDRYQAGLLVEADDRRLLVDCGSGVLQRLAATEAGYDDLDAVLLTHHHLDHVADLLPLLKARWLAGTDPLEVVGPPDTPALLEGLVAVHDYLEDRVEYDARSIEPGSFSIVDLDADALRTRHSIDCLAYRLRGDGGDFTFSGDTEAFDGLAAFADGSAAFAHDCSFPDEVDVSNHPTPSQLGRALAGHDYGTVYLTHLYPHARGKHREMLASLGEHYDGDVEFARDGLTIEL